MSDMYGDDDDGWWERNAIYWKGQADERSERLNRAITYAEELEGLIRNLETELREAGCGCSRVANAYHSGNADS